MALKHCHIIYISILDHIGAAANNFIFMFQLISEVCFIICEIISGLLTHNEQM